MNEICFAQPLIKKEIKKALKKYKTVWKDNEKVFEEMCFCILTPQSSAKGANKCINALKENNVLYKGTAKEKEKYLKNIRFYITKARRLELVQKEFPKDRIKDILINEGILKNIKKCREFLVQNVNGFGMKEASHFLRNIGFFEEVAILDRHILKNLVKYKIIDEIPKSINKKKYIEIEEKMKHYCEKNGLKLAEIDLIFWSNETGEVFK